MEGRLGTRGGTVGEWEREGESDYFFHNFSESGFFEGFAFIELSLGEGPVATGFAVDHGHFVAATTRRAEQNTTGRTNEVVGLITRNNQFCIHRDDVVPIHTFVE
jgi:hypothetical protein